MNGIGIERPCERSQKPLCTIVQSNLQPMSAVPVFQKCDIMQTFAMLSHHYINFVMLAQKSCFSGRKPLRRASVQAIEYEYRVVFSHSNYTSATPSKAHVKFESPESVFLAY